MSLNFRAHTNQSTSFLTTLQQALGTALGHRPDASAILRETLESDSTQSFEALLENLGKRNCAPAFFVLCSPEKAVLMEKDYTSTKLTSNDKFLPCANHDARVEDWTQEEFNTWATALKDPLLTSTIARKQCNRLGSSCQECSRLEEVDANLASPQFSDYVWSHNES